MSSDSNQRTTLFAEVLKFTQTSDYDKALKSCNRILHAFPEDYLAFQTKIICCIQLNKFKEAVDFMQKNPKLADSLKYEKAYCYYRLHNSQSAYDCLMEMKDNTWKKKELLAQILYRLERFEECYNLYIEVIKESSDEYDEERQTNLVAIMANMSQTMLKGKKIPVPASPSYEHLFNMGCALLSQGLYQEASAMITKAEQQCIETLREDGMTEEDIDDELSAISLQRAYICHKLGNEKEALNIYSSVIKNKPSNLEMTAVASINVLAINREQNMFESKKRMKALEMKEVFNKISKKQDKARQLNMALHLYITNQYEISREYAKVFARAYPEEIAKYHAVDAGVDYKTMGINETLLNLKEKNIPSRFTIHLGMVQHVLREGKRKMAFEFFARLDEKDRYRLGIVSAIATLHYANNDHDAAAATLEDALKYYKSPGKDRATLNELWRHAALLMSEEGDVAGAIKSLEELYETDKSDDSTLAQLIIAYIENDVDKAEKLSVRLPPAPPSDLDLSELESPNWLSYVKTRKNKEANTPVSKSRNDSAGAVAKESPVKTKRKRRRKLPSNADGQADPERWLPKYERSGYRPKKVRKGRVDVGKGTQGATSEASAAFDMSAKSPKTQTQPSPPVVTPGPSGGQKKSKQKKHK